MENLCGWTRDVDWGNAPSWSAVGVAIVVGFFTINNVQTARRSFQASTWERQVAVARRVYASTEFTSLIPRGEPETLTSRNPDLRLNTGLFEVVEEDGFQNRKARADLFGCLIEIHNPSDEPVGNVVVVIAGLNGGVQHESLSPLQPKSLRRVVIFAEHTPKDWNRPDSPTVSLEFSDSAGNFWRRQGTDAPTLLPKC